MVSLVMISCSFYEAIPSVGKRHIDGNCFVRLYQAYTIYLTIYLCAILANEKRRRNEGRKMKHNEDSRVKIPALIHLTRLGYEYLSLKEYVNLESAMG